MKPSLWLLARCQQAVWNSQELYQAIEKRDHEALLRMDRGRAYRDLLFVTFAQVTGFGPLLWA